MDALANEWGNQIICVLCRSGANDRIRPNYLHTLCHTIANLTLARWFCTIIVAPPGGPRARHLNFRRAILAIQKAGVLAGRSCARQDFSGGRNNVYTLGAFMHLSQIDLLSRKGAETTLGGRRQFAKVSSIVFVS